MVLAQTREIPIELLDTLLVRLDAFAFEAIIKLQ